LGFSNEKRIAMQSIPRRDREDPETGIEAGIAKLFESFPD